MLIALNQFRLRHRHRLAAILLTFALCWLLLAAHSAFAERHMGDGMAACLAVAETAALMLAIAIAASSTARIVLARPSACRLHGMSRSRLAHAAPDPRSRAGPEFLQVFRL